MIVKTALVTLVAAGLATAHMQMNWPYPLRSQFDPQNDWSNIDYSMTNPLKSDGMPCHVILCEWLEMKDLMLF